MELINKKDALHAVLHNTGDAAVAAVENIKTVDAVPVVRCKDCRWFDREEPDNLYGYCHAAKHGHITSRWEISIYRKCKEDFYCADGEREEYANEQQS